MAQGKRAIDLIREKLAGASTPGSNVASGMEAGGRDNRSPYVGGTQYPTEGSKNLASSLFAQSKSSAEVGPAPSVNQLSDGGTHDIRDVSVKQFSHAGMLPKIGADMSIVNDPLIQYFASRPGQEEFKKYAEQLEANLEAMPKAKEEKEQSSENVSPSKDAVGKSAEQIDKTLRDLFANYPTQKTVIS